MIYRERYEADLYEEPQRDLVLSRQSTLGPWLVMGLGIVLVLFLSYLVYSNVVFPAPVLSLPERSLRAIADPLPVTAVSFPDFHAPVSGHPWRAALPHRPPSRAGYGWLDDPAPALLQEGMAVTARDPPENRPEAASLPH